MKFANQVILIQIRLIVNAVCTAFFQEINHQLLLNLKRILLEQIRITVIAKLHTEYVIIVVQKVGVEVQGSKMGPKIERCSFLIKNSVDKY